jgi:hypothetical protein
MPTYRPLLPSPRPRLAPDHPHLDYTSPHQLLPVRFTTDARHPSASLSQDRQGSGVAGPEGEPPHLPMVVPPVSPSHSNVNIIEPYVPNAQTFHAPTTSQWNSASSANLNPQNTSVYYGDGAGSLAASSAAQSNSSYPASHDEITANTGPEPYQTMAPYLNLLHGDLSGSTGVPREPLPSLSILQEAYSFSYDFSVAMVAQSDVSAPSGATDSCISHKAASSSNSSQIPRVLGPGSNKPGGPSRDLDLAPLNTLARRQPYRREPMDDRALRMLWPRSP